MHEADAPPAVDDERRRSGDVDAGEPEPMIDAVAFDHRAVWVDQEGQREAMGAAIVRHLGGALADDHQHLNPEGVIRREMGLQLLQLPATRRSPGASNEDDQRRFRAQDLAEMYLFPLGCAQREEGGLVAQRQRGMICRHACSSSGALRCRLCTSR
jgi:hypothetical protein